MLGTIEFFVLALIMVVVLIGLMLWLFYRGG